MPETKTKNLIIGHSLWDRLQSDVIAGFHSRMEGSFNLIAKVDQILSLNGGKKNEHVEKGDLQRICDIHLHIAVVIIGKNGVCFNTGPKGLAGCIMSLATILCNHAYSHYAVICKLLPCFDAPHCILHKINGQSSANKWEWYLEFYLQQVAAVNLDTNEAAGKLKLLFGACNCKNLDFKIFFSLLSDGENTFRERNSSLKVHVMHKKKRKKVMHHSHFLLSDISNKSVTTHWWSKTVSILSVSSFRHTCRLKRKSGFHLAVVSVQWEEEVAFHRWASGLGCCGQAGPTQIQGCFWFW